MAIKESGPAEKRLLVVDDEDGPRQSLNMIFSDEFEVTVAASGEEAVQLSAEAPFNVVITDIRMRGMSGIDVLRELKKLDPNTEVIVLTAYETLDSARQAISLGASEYLKKPFDLEHIQSVVHRCYENYLFTTQQEAVIRKDVNAAKTNFLEIVSHELNTPMNGILGFIELLEDTEMSEEQVDYVGMIRDCSLKYFEHVQDILTYAKLTMSDGEISSGGFNPATVLIKVTNEAEPPEGVALELDMEESLPEHVGGPEQEIRIILRKLLQNALKFTGSGEVRLGVRAYSGDDGCRRLAFSVSDTGPGIDPELVESGRLFDPFSQGDSTSKRAYDGLGLGLSLCKRLCDRIGSELDVSSEPGEGSVFSFTVPVREET